MCTSSPKAPKASAVSAPTNQPPPDMRQASSDAARQQAMRRGLSSVWTRYPDTSAPADGSAVAAKAASLGG